MRKQDETGFSRYSRELESASAALGLEPAPTREKKLKLTVPK